MARSRCQYLIHSHRKNLVESIELWTSIKALWKVRLFAKRVLNVELSVVDRPVGLLTITCWKLLQAWRFNTIWQSKHSEEGVHGDQHSEKETQEQTYRATTQPFETNTLKVRQRAEPLWIATS